MRNRKELKDSTCINNVKMSADMELCFISVFYCKKTNRGYTKDTWVCYINLNGENSDERERSEIWLTGFYWWKTTAA